MTLPLSTPGSCCGHNLNMHSGAGLEGVCIVCSCVGFVPDMEDGGMLPDPPRQCRARYDSDQSLRCQEMVTEATTHVGVSPHWAINRRGETVRWAQDRSFYPVFDSDPLMTEQVREDVASSLANPERTTVGNGSSRLEQVGGEHYKKFKIQPWDVIDEYDLSFYAGNALKYLLRAGHKGSKIEDLKKARHYLDKMIELESGDG